MCIDAARPQLKVTTEQTGRSPPSNTAVIDMSELLISFKNHQVVAYTLNSIATVKGYLPTSCYLASHLGVNKAGFTDIEVT